MTFAADIKRWSTVAEFEAYLKGYDPAIAPWAKGTVLHHTWTPTLNQWRGKASVVGAQGYYVGLGWNAGPHLFIAHGSPRPEWDGIYQLTPLNLQGIHAGACNSHMWGIEIVGRYDAAPWPAELAEMVYGVTCALLRWRGLLANVRGHRECLPNKSCPGNAIKMDAVRTEVARRLRATPSEYITEHDALMSTPRASAAQCVRFILRRPHGEYTDADVKTIVGSYFAICPSIGLDPLVCIAQLIHETGNLTSALSQRRDKDGRDLRNPAGIGVWERKELATKDYRAGCVWDADVKGYRPACQFRTWTADAVPAHVGRLLTYAINPTGGTDAQRSLSALAMEYRQLPAKCWGSAPDLRRLGSGPNEVDGCGWAGDGAGEGQSYGAKLAAIMNAIRGL